MTEENIKNPGSPPPNSSRGTNPWPQRAALFSLLLVIGFFAFSPLGDYDFWWHLKVGELIYQTKDIVREDLFTFTSPGAYWIDHSWLAELAIFGVWQVGGSQGVLFLKVFFITATFLFLYVALGRGVKFNAPTYIPLLILLVTAATAAATRVGWEVRPQTFSYLFFTLFLYLLESRRARCLLPLLMIFWANTHGSFFFGLVIVGAYTAEAWITRLLKNVGAQRAVPLLSDQTLANDSKEIKNLSILFLATFAASLINPHPWQLYTHPWIHLHQVFPQGIAEWTRPGFTDAPAFWGFLLLTLLSLPLALKKIRPAHMLLWLIFLYPGLRHLRNVPYLTLAAAPLLNGALAHSLQRAEEILPWLSQPLDKPSRQSLNPLYLLSAAFLIFTFLAWAAGWGGQGEVDYQRFPQKAVNFYQQAKVQGPLFNTYDWGGYLTFRLWPREKVFILGITSDEETFRQFYHISEGNPFWRALLDRHRINAILTRTCYDEGGMIPYIAKLYLDTDWWLIYQDEVACLLVRAAENNRYLESYRLPKEKLFQTVLEEEKKLLKRKPPHPHALYYKALAQYVLGDPWGAEKTINILQKVSPGSTTADKLLKAIKAGKNPPDFLRENYG